MRTRTLGPDGPEVSAIGLGCMALPVVLRFGPTKARRLRRILRALELGLQLPGHLRHATGRTPTSGRGAASIASRRE